MEQNKTAPIFTMDEEAPVKALATRNQSISSVELYDRCPALYKAKYLDKMSVPPNGAMLYGRVVHEAVEAIHKIAKDNPSHLSLDEVNKVLSDLATKQAKSLKAADISRLHTGLVTYAQSLVEVQTLLMFEELLEFKLSSGDVFVFKPDRIDLLADNSVRLVELKSGSFIPSKDELEGNFQVQVYMLGIRKLLPDTLKYPRIYGSYYSFGKGGYVTTVANEEAFPMLESYLEAKVKAMREDVTWGRKVNDNCNMCPISNDCKMFRESLLSTFDVVATEVLKSGSVDQLALLYSKMSNVAKVQKANLEVVKDKLIALVEDNLGSLQTTEGIYSIGKTIRGAYTVDQCEYSTLKLAKFKAEKEKPSGKKDTKTPKTRK